MASSRLQDGNGSLQKTANIRCRLANLFIYSGMGVQQLIDLCQTAHDESRVGRRMQVRPRRRNRTVGMLRPQHKFRRQFQTMQQLFMMIESGVFVNESTCPCGHFLRRSAVARPGKAVRRIGHPAVEAAGCVKHLTLHRILHEIIVR